MSDTSDRQPIATVYGYPRQGASRQLKKATESYWAGRINSDEYLAAVRERRAERLAELQQAGIEELPINDFSLYDHVLDTAVMLGAIPERHLVAVPNVDSPQGQLDRYFAMARGSDAVAPLEMTKWFDTNYHYLVPELRPDESFALDTTKLVTELMEAKEAGYVTRPVIVGPITFLLLAKPVESADPSFSTIQLLDAVLPSYVELLGQLKSLGCEWVQIDEPILVTDLSSTVLEEVRRCYDLLGNLENRPKIVVASYFERLGESLPVLAAAPIEGIAMDFTGHGAQNVSGLKAIGGIPNKRLIAGIVDGHNIWTTDLTKALATLEAVSGLAQSVDVAGSCSFLHVPLDVELEDELPREFIPWLSFARQKLGELTLLARALRDGKEAVASELATNAAHLADRAASPIVHVDAIRSRAAKVTAADLRRKSPYAARHDIQHDRLHLPDLPTTTIGSFPQTPALRRARAELAKGVIDRSKYDEAMREEIKSVITHQEELDIDVLVHGEPERNDMVQYFAEQLTGYIATKNGWVQSYGSRYVRPPIIIGDVARPKPMTVGWAKYAQSLTSRPVKGMLTGPVTMLAWSFVRDDQPLGDTAYQVALALRDEVSDLEAAGVAIIQVDEPALRETLPLRLSDRAEYLKWAVDSFLLTTTGVDDATQVHTHMCYAEFGDILQAIIDMDADVISLEAARSKMAIVGELASSAYPNEVGPGVWDIHSPRVPSSEEITGWLRHAVEIFPADRLWVNPDCGLKTRGYEEVHASLVNLVSAAKAVRASN